MDFSFSWFVVLCRGLNGKKKEILFGSLRNAKFSFLIFLILKVLQFFHLIVSNNLRLINK